MDVMASTDQSVGLCSIESVAVSTATAPAGIADNVVVTVDDDTCCC